MMRYVLLTNYDRWDATSAFRSFVEIYFPKQNGFNMFHVRLQLHLFVVDVILSKSGMKRSKSQCPHIFSFNDKNWCKMGFVGMIPWN